MVVDGLVWYLGMAVVVMACEGAAWAGITAGDEDTYLHNESVSSDIGFIVHGTTTSLP